MSSDTLMSVPRTAHIVRPVDLRELMVIDVRTDGNTQQRVTCDECTVAAYAALMCDGHEFPPVAVWFDGRNYWLTDGFHRLAAAMRTGRTRISAEVHSGDLSDAQWHSFGSNATHGLPRTKADIELIITRALQHPRAANVGNLELARYLGIPETTVRRWRKRLSSPGGEDNIRVVHRGRSTYQIRTANIGKAGARKTRTDGSFKVQLSEMKRNASQDARRVLNVVGNWIFGAATPAACLAAIETIVREVAGTETHQQNG